MNEIIIGALAFALGAATPYYKKLVIKLFGNIYEKLSHAIDKWF